MDGVLISWTIGQTNPWTTSIAQIVSGEAPEHPVVSKKSGQVYERRLIVKYIEDNGKDPVTGEDLSEEDLLDIKSSTLLFYAVLLNFAWLNCSRLPLCC